MVEQCYNRCFPKQAEFRRLGVPCLLLCWGVLIFRAVPTWAVPPRYVSRIDARQKRLENLEVKYDYSVDYNPPKGWGKSFLASAGGRNLAARGIKLGPPADGIFRYHCEMSTLHGLIYFRQTIAKSSVPMASKYGITGSQILIYAPTRFESLTYPLDGGRPFGHITNPSDKLPPCGSPGGSASVILYALGLRPFGHDWFHADAFGKMVARAEGRRLLFIYRSPDMYVNKWIFDLRNHLAITRYELSVRGGSGLHPELAVICSKFRTVNGVALPGKLVARTLTNTPGYFPVVQKFAHVTYKIGEAKNIRSDYIMVWPRGSVVLDSRINKSFLIKSGNRTLTDKQIYNLLHRAVPAPPAAKEK